MHTYSIYVPYMSNYDPYVSPVVFIRYPPLDFASRKWHTEPHAHAHAHIEREREGGRERQTHRRTDTRSDIGTQELRRRDARAQRQQSGVQREG